MNNPEAFPAVEPARERRGVNRDLLIAAALLLSQPLDNPSMPLLSRGGTSAFAPMSLGTLFGGPAEADARAYLSDSPASSLALETIAFRRDNAQTPVAAQAATQQPRTIPAASTPSPTPPPLPPPPPAPSLNRGELANTTALAEAAHLPLEDILAMRESGLGWGEIAHSLGTQLGAARQFAFHHGKNGAQAVGSGAAPSPAQVQRHHLISVHP